MSTENQWVKLPRELRELITAYGTTMYDLGASKFTGRNELALIEKSSITRDALAAKLLPHHQPSVKDPTK
jgi:hypothetical protein